MTSFTLDDVRGVCKARDAWWTVLLVDPLATRLVKLTANRTNITPNQLTWLAFILGLAAAVSFTQATWPWLALGGLLFHLSFVADCMDGKIARLKGTGTVFGLWLDFIFDQIRVVACAMAIGFGMFSATGNIVFLYVGFGIIVLDLFRYLDGPQIAKVRRTMRGKLAAKVREAFPEGEIPAASAVRKLGLPPALVEDALSRREAARRARLEQEAAGQNGFADGAAPAEGPPVEAAPAENMMAPGEDDPDAIENITVGQAAKRVSLQEEFHSRFPWYDRIRTWLIQHRIRTHLVSGIEFQMAAFVVGPILGPMAIIPVTALAGAGMLFFEFVLVYKLWLSTKDFQQKMERLEALIASQAQHHPTPSS